MRKKAEGVIMEDFNVVDATQGQVVDVQPQQSEPVNSESDGVAPAEPKQEKPAQTPEENARFAEMRRKTEAETERKLITELYGHLGITSKQELLEYQERQQYQAEAEELGYDPDLYEKAKRYEQIEQTEKQKKAENDRRTAEAAEFLEAYPDFKTAELPKEVLDEWLSGTPLKIAYKQFKTGSEVNTIKSQLEAERARVAELEKALSIQKGNAENADSATAGVTGSGSGDAEYISAAMFEANRHDQNWVKKNFNKILTSRPTWKA